MPRTSALVLASSERRQLEEWASGPSRSRLARRARIVLLAADGRNHREIAARLGLHVETVARWRARFVLNRTEGLVREAPRAGAAKRIRRSMVQRIVGATTGQPPGTGHPWTTRTLARNLRVNHMVVHRVWKTHGLGNPRAPDGSARRGRRPWIDLSGVFVTPRARAVVFSVDERRGPVGPRASLPELVPNPTGNPAFSGLVEASGAVVRALEAIASAPSRVERGSDSEASLLVFLRGVEQKARRDLRLEVVFDRPLSRIGRRAARWLAAHPRFRVFTTPRDQAWSHAVDGWLRRWESAGLARESLLTAGKFARDVSGARPDARRPFERFSWKPGAPWISPTWRPDAAGPLPDPGEARRTFPPDPPDRPRGR